MSNNVYLLIVSVIIWFTLIVGCAFIRLVTPEGWKLNDLASKIMNEADDPYFIAAICAVVLFVYGGS